ncbi:MAG: cyclic nucleotide-binding domain-containing protein [Proteobacteria bacterium]|nr:cyclic nucleotide-binding domain-containing protein [Pseudomonadota bacterium]
MPNSFDPQNPPFDRLTPQEMEALRQALDIGYFRPGQTILGQQAAADSLFIVIKGAVEERDADELIALLGPKDSFDSHALVQGQSRHAFVAREETLCYLLPRDVALNLIKANPRFGAFFYLDLSRKLDAMARDEEDSRIGTLMRARIADMPLSPAAFIDAADTIETAGHTMSQIDSNALFVRDGDRVGIVTGMNLSKATVLQRKPIDTPIGTICHYDVISLRPDDFVYSALILMTKTNKRRIAIHDGTHYVGILDDIGLLGFLAGNAQLVAGRIERAAGLSDLTVAAREIGEQVRILRRQGLKVEVIAEIISDLNRRLFAKLFDMVAPPEIRGAACLAVMGSEGRGEQTLRTDQDNALILAHPVEAAILDRFRADFTTALEGFGFEPCPGNVMVRNPIWSQTVDEYGTMFRRWVALPEPETHMDVAILYDAVAVAGNAQLLADVKAGLVEAVRGRSAFMVHFARATEAFPMPIGFFNNLLTPDGKGDAVDLKKGGIFPIVHGIRSMALERGLAETNTAQRIQRIVEAGTFSRDFGRDLTQALYLLMTFRLDAQLAAAGAATALVRPDMLSSTQRDVLREALGVVKQLRDIVRRHFNLGAF